MLSRSGTKALAAILVLGVMLGACSDIYYDRREAVFLGASDAVAVNKMAHMVDPWPRHSANRNLAFNGERAQAAHERYRQNRVITPVNVTTSSNDYQKVQQSAAAQQSATQQSTSATPAAPVKGPNGP
ncbi:MAG: hypothetical protein ACRECO_11520 [Xanthobacteraceae bacterium]